MLADESTAEQIGGSAGPPRPHSSAPDPQALRDMLLGLFRDADNETFHDGMDSRFSMRLHHIILDYGVDAVEALGKALDGANVEVAGEALRQAGYVEDADTHEARLSLLEGALASPDVSIRDGASIGIEAMDDPAAIDSLRAAAKNEPCAWLRQYLREVLAQLQDGR